MSKLRQLPPEEMIHNARIYDEYHRKYNMEDGWDKGNKEANFQSMMHVVELTGVPISGASCLDVGCGSGDLSLFLRKRGARKYLGVDIYPLALEKAKEKYPNEEFVQADILESTFQTLPSGRQIKFDYVFSSGALTVKLQTLDNYEFLESMVSKMWKLSKIGIVFNCLTDVDTNPDPELFFYNVDQVLKICHKVAPKAHISSIPTTHVAQSHFYLYR